MTVPADSDVSTVPAVTAEGEAFTSARLHYTDVPVPAAGQSIEIAPGVRWARIPLPLDLNHINVWLLDTDDGCVIVDTGLAASVGKDAWENIEREYFSQLPVRAVFITHIHPDHIGLAAWLQERHRVPVLMSRRTYEQAEQLFVSPPGRDEAGEAFFRSHGITDEAQLQLMFRPERFVRMTSGLPRVEQMIADGQIIQWQKQDWTALETNGHAEGHLCLWNAAEKLLISGDQVLPAISSNISHRHIGSDPNPLGSYLSSLQRLRALPDDTLVLPSHGVPFRGLQLRIDDLIRHHVEQLDKLAGVCVEPKLAAELLPVMFRRELTGMHLFLALGEALAHLEYLVHAGRLRREIVREQIRYSTNRS